MTRRNIFLDCGTHLGQGIQEISKSTHIDDSWEVFTWEANPHTFNRFPFEKFSHIKNLTRFQKAIGVYDGTIELNIQSVDEKDLNQCGMGSSVINLDVWNSVPNIHEGYFSSTEKVECIDFSNWIKTNCSEDDFILIKMDIEGAEYEVLEKMIVDDTLKYVDVLHLEWHNWVFSNQEPYTIREKYISKKMHENKVYFYSWR